jgi:hypothetical protein
MPFLSILFYYPFLLFFHNLSIFLLRFAQDNLDVKKVSAPSKNPSKWLIMCFSRLKNIKSLTFKIRGSLIVNLPLLEKKQERETRKNKEGRRNMERL